jgi:hypothetical protein
VDINSRLKIIRINPLNLINSKKKEVLLMLFFVILNNLFSIQIFTQFSGIISGVKIFAFTHFLGAQTILFLLVLSQAAHQLNELLAIIKCLQLLIKCKSLIEDLVSVKIYFLLIKKGKVFFTNSISSEKMKKIGFLTL